MNFSEAEKKLFLLHCYFDTMNTLYVNQEIRLTQFCVPEKSDLFQSCVPEFQ